MAQADTNSTTPKLPRALPKAAVNKVSAAIEAHLDAVQALHEFLDVAEGDADEEDSGDDEPSIGSTESSGWSSDDHSHWASGSNDDREGDEHDGREPDVDDEESLGWTNRPNQAYIPQELASNPFFPFDGEGPDTDREPSLGSIGAGSAAHSQTSWAAGGVDDREQDVGNEGEPDVDDEPRCEPTSADLLRRALG